MILACLTAFAFGESFCAAKNHVYSLRNDFTGFASAAFMLWKLTVKNATTTAARPANANTHH
ncbi:MAG: hypothetical protein IPM82_29260 [Saprospiraceae bacterium]|nr:hypothetical protein [Saprospiraceae bacterium]